MKKLFILFMLAPFFSFSDDRLTVWCGDSDLAIGKKEKVCERWYKVSRINEDFCKVSGVIIPTSNIVGGHSVAWCGDSKLVIGEKEKFCGQWIKIVRINEDFCKVSGMNVSESYDMDTKYKQLESFLKNLKKVNSRNSF